MKSSIRYVGKPFPAKAGTALCRIDNCGLVCWPQYKYMIWNLVFAMLASLSQHAMRFCRDCWSGHRVVRTGCHIRTRKISFLKSKLNIELRKKLEHCFIWLRDLDAKKIGAEIFRELWNVVLDENGEDKMISESIMLYCFNGVAIAAQCTAKFSRSIVLPQI